jgi:pentatricopeptide repeat protein
METGSEIHREIEENGLLDRDIVVGNALLDMYAKCGSIAKACEVFEQLPLRNVVSWSTLIACYAKHDRAEDALQCFEEMKRKGVLPDAITFACSLKACMCIGALSKGIRIHGEIEKLGLLGRDSIVGNALVDMYAKCGRLHKAKELFLSLPSRDVVSWNALLAGYVKHERDEAVLASFEQMQAEGISPDSVTLAYVLKACGSMGAGGKGAQIHNEIDGKILAEQGLTIRNALMDMYAKCGLLRKACRMFDELSDPDIVSFNVLIAGHAQLGQCEDVFRSLGTMEAVGMKPDSATFLSVLHSCNHGGLQLQAQLFFKAMIENYGLIPTVEHYTSMIDLFSRAGQLEKALAMLEKLPLHPDIVMWCTLLGSCKKWGDVWLAKLAFDNALSLDENEASAYVSMFNIYANAHMHSDLHAEDNPWECDTLLKCK